MNSRNFLILFATILHLFGAQPNAHAQTNIPHCSMHGVRSFKLQGLDHYSNVDPNLNFCADESKLSPYPELIKVIDQATNTIQNLGRGLWIFPVEMGSRHPCKLESHLAKTWALSFKRFWTKVANEQNFTSCGLRSNALALQLGHGLLLQLRKPLLSHLFSTPSRARRM